jgi:N-acetylneuraminic acid mutarotase
MIAMLAALQLIWTDKAPLPRAQGGGAAALFGETMLVAGGTAWEGGVKLFLNDTQVYDVRTNKWRAGPALPEPLAYAPFAQSETSLEIFGRTVWRIDSALSRWTKAGETPNHHLLGRAARVGNRVFLFGGCSDVADMATCSDAVWMREDSGAWRQVAKLPGGVVALSAVAVLEGRLYLFGGCSAKVVNRAEAWSFDPASFQFRRLRDLPSARRGPTAAASGRRILLFGGYTDSGFTAEVWSYDPKHDQYASEAPLPVPMLAIEFFAHGNMLLGAGGEDRMKSRSARTFAATR